MSIERVFHCDGPECERHVATRQISPPMFLTVTDPTDDARTERHFCGWDCLLREAASREPEQVVPGSPFDAD